MKKTLLGLGAVALLLGTPLSVIAIGKNEKGCLAGGAIGGVGGHLLGNSTTTTVLGAAAGCAAGTLYQKNKTEKQQNAQRAQRSKTARNERETKRERELKRVNGQS
jgi:outer membrane lipoprotein SlyB